MTDTTRLVLRFGRNNFPDDAQAVFGARLIWPNDLLWDRQDLQARDDEAKTALVAWLNGEPAGTGAILKLKQALAVPEALGLSYSGDQEAVIYEDELGKVIGSAQSSHGYVYVAAWLKS